MIVADHAERVGWHVETMWTENQNIVRSLQGLHISDFINSGDRKRQFNSNGSYNQNLRIVSGGKTIVVSMVIYKNNVHSFMVYTTRYNWNSGEMWKDFLVDKWSGIPTCINTCEAE
jgi:hypothetical protein